MATAVGMFRLNPFQNSRETENTFFHYKSNRDARDGVLLPGEV